jgi:hypothetical protein
VIAAALREAIAYRQDHAGTGLEHHVQWRRVPMVSRFARPR